MSTDSSVLLATKPAPSTPARGTSWAIIVGGAIGLIASLILVVERFELLSDPTYVPSCSLNPVLSCGSVMTSAQAAVFGFPNPIVGVPAFTLVVITGVLSIAKVSLPQWYWIGMAAGLTVGGAFVHWLIFQSLYRIGALCPYCMAVWAVTVPLWAIAISCSLDREPKFIRRWKWTFVAVWSTAIALLCAERFWSYWSTLI